MYAYESDDIIKDKVILEGWNIRLLEMTDVLEIGDHLNLPKGDHHDRLIFWSGSKLKEKFVT